VVRISTTNASANAAMKLQRKDTADQPKPFVFPPSGQFDGFDGQWSTFIVNVGDNGQDNGKNGQDFRVFISTSGSATLVPQKADWCTVPNENDCAKARGIQIYQAKESQGFQTSAADPWKPEGVYSLNLESNLEYGNDTTHNGNYGYAVVGLGASSPDTPQLLSQIVAGITTIDYPIGYFGLSTVPINFGQEGIDTFMTVFSQGNSTIPSKSYAYTAGAHYRK
jgi:hypothetical protein